MLAALLVSVAAGKGQGRARRWYDGFTEGEDGAEPDPLPKVAEQPLEMNKAEPKKLRAIKKAGAVEIEFDDDEEALIFLLTHI